MQHVTTTLTHTWWSLLLSHSWCVAPDSSGNLGTYTNYGDLESCNIAAHGCCCGFLLHTMYLRNLWFTKRYGNDDKGWSSHHHIINNLDHHFFQVFTHYVIMHFANNHFKFHTVSGKIYVPCEEEGPRIGALKIAYFLHWDFFKDWR